MPRGVIKFYNESRGYGFIQSEEQAAVPSDVFVHYSQIADDERSSLKEGEEVTFEVKEGKRGLEAVNVQKAS